MIRISAVPIFEDNYIWVLQKGRHAIAIDPGDALPLIHHLKENQLELAGVLITHHHHDHVDGLPVLWSHYQMPVFGPASIKNVSNPVQEGETLQMLGTDFKVMSVPGHTLDHLAYVGAGALFCGDTLFAAGCGRLFEGTAEQMYASLQRFATLPDHTLVCCAHEYTLTNLRFALTVEPDNTVLLERIQSDAALREQALPTLPSSIAKEKATNPYLRCDQASVVHSAKKQNPQVENALDVFATLRKWKDNFR
ncbi:hydroxyacylglutathione hydrolase [Iodobacter ciconiae]|uniref:Hydroxyacylglutathione hydrolase n=1 Tax=Iodobacter ciconiae TaxID=2496266 RepID=A0A3S8ZW13_9NEIS|nr:hydroxyacylglutathione hydrolase [Iodobacter ciconiae]AZN37614.1 hydroxyacylglutathione hydrolase [Iodobacter ciconiae]